MRRHFTVGYWGGQRGTSVRSFREKRDNNTYALIRTAHNGVFNLPLVAAFAVRKGLFTHETLHSASRLHEPLTDASLQRPLSAFNVSLF